MHIYALQKKYTATLFKKWANPKIYRSGAPKGGAGGLSTPQFPTKKRGKKKKKGQRGWGVGGQENYIEVRNYCLPSSFKVILWENETQLRGPAPTKS